MNVFYFYDALGSRYIQFTAPCSSREVSPRLVFAVRVLVVRCGTRNELLHFSSMARSMPSLPVSERVSARSSNLSRDSNAMQRCKIGFCVFTVTAAIMTTTSWIFAIKMTLRMSLSAITNKYCCFTYSPERFMRFTILNTQTNGTRHQIHKRLAKQ